MLQQTGVRKTGAVSKNNYGLYHICSSLGRRSDKLVQIINNYFDQCMLRPPQKKNRQNFVSIFNNYFSIVRLQNGAEKIFEADNKTNTGYFNVETKITNYM